MSSDKELTEFLNEVHKTDGHYMEKKSIYQRAIEAWGRDSQMHMATGECGEFIAEMNKHFNQGKSSIEDVASESDNVNRGPFIVYRLTNGHRDYAEGNFNYMSEAQELADELNGDISSEGE